MENATAKLSNTIYGQSMTKINNMSELKREDILNNYSEEVISKCWDAFSKFIAKNYQAGRGTYIPSFGVFTFNNVEVSLEGTTNQFVRDIKSRRPVFIVSSDFVESLKPGMYNSNNGIVYYNQKKNNNISHVKLNYAELSYSLSMNKTEYCTILNNLIKFIGDSIRKGQFKNKDMPGLGVLMTRSNVIAVKFNDNLCEEVKNIPQKLITTKKHVQLYMDYEGNNQGLNMQSLTNLPNVGKTLQKLRPKT
jgi:hypothetical protein